MGCAVGGKPGQDRLATAPSLRSRGGPGAGVDLAAQGLARLDQGRAVGSADLGAGKGVAGGGQGQALGKAAGDIVEGAILVVAGVSRGWSRTGPAPSGTRRRRAGRRPPAEASSSSIQPGPDGGDGAFVAGDGQEDQVPVAIAEDSPGGWSRGHLAPPGRGPPPGVERGGAAGPPAWPGGPAAWSTVSPAPRPRTRESGLDGHLLEWSTPKPVSS